MNGTYVVKSATSGGSISAAGPVASGAGTAAAQNEAIEKNQTNVQPYQPRFMASLGVEYNEEDRALQMSENDKLLVSADGVRKCFDFETNQFDFMDSLQASRDRGIISGGDNSYLILGRPNTACFTPHLKEYKDYNLPPPIQAILAEADNKQSISANCLPGTSYFYIAIDKKFIFHKLLDNLFEPVVLYGHSTALSMHLINLLHVNGYAEDNFPWLAVCFFKNSVSFYHTINAGTTQLQLSHLDYKIDINDNSIVASAIFNRNGGKTRVFFSSEDGDILELINMEFIVKDSVATTVQKPSYKSILHNYVTKRFSQLKSIFGTTNPIVKMFVDEERSILYYIRNNYAFGMVYLGEGEHDTPSFIQEIGLKDFERSLQKNLPTIKAFNKHAAPVSIQPIEIDESSVAQVMIVTSEGSRIYCTIYPRRATYNYITPYASTDPHGSTPQSTQAPIGFEVTHIRHPPSSRFNDTNEVRVNYDTLYCRSWLKSSVLVSHVYTENEPRSIGRIELMSMKVENSSKRDPLTESIDMQYFFVPGRLLCFTMVPKHDSSRPFGFKSAWNDQSNRLNNVKTGGLQKPVLKVSETLRDVQEWDERNLVIITTTSVIVFNVLKSHIRIRDCLTDGVTRNFALKSCLQWLKPIEFGVQSLRLMANDELHNNAGLHDFLFGVLKSMAVEGADGSSQHFASVGPAGGMQNQQVSGGIFNRLLNTSISDFSPAHDACFLLFARIIAPIWDAEWGQMVKVEKKSERSYLDSLLSLIWSDSKKPQRNFVFMYKPYAVNFKHIVDELSKFRKFLQKNYTKLFPTHVASNTYDRCFIERLQNQRLNAFLLCEAMERIEQILTFWFTLQQYEFGVLEWILDSLCHFYFQDNLQTCERYLCLRGMLGVPGFVKDQSMMQLLLNEFGIVRRDIGGNQEMCEIFNRLESLLNEVCPKYFDLAKTILWKLERKIESIEATNECIDTRGLSNLHSLKIDAMTQLLTHLPLRSIKGIVSCFVNKGALFSCALPVLVKQWKKLANLQKRFETKMMNGEEKRAYFDIVMQTEVATLDVLKNLCLPAYLNRETRALEAKDVKEILSNAFGESSEKISFKSSAERASFRNQHIDKLNLPWHELSKAALDTMRMANFVVFFQHLLTEVNNITLHYVMFTWVMQFQMSALVLALPLECIPDNFSRFLTENMQNWDEFEIRHKLCSAQRTKEENIRQSLQNGGANETFTESMNLEVKKPDLALSELLRVAAKWSDKRGEYNACAEICKRIIRCAQPMSVEDRVDAANMLEYSYSRMSEDEKFRETEIWSAWQRQKREIRDICVLIKLQKKMMEYARGMEGVTRLLASECYNLSELYLIAENADLHEWTLIFYALNENESDEDKVKGMDAWWKSLFKKLIMRKRLDDPKTLDVFMRKYNCVLENIKQFAKTVYSDYKRLLPLFEEIYMKNYVRKHGAKGLGDVAGMFHSSFKIDSQGLLEAYDGLAQYDADKDESAQFCLYIIETIVTVIKRFIDADWKVRVNGIEQEQVGDEFFEFASGLVSRIRERMIESVEKECELVSNSAWTRAIDVLDAFKSRIEKKRAGVGNFRGRRTRLQAVRDSEQFSPRRDRSRSNCSIQRDSQF